MKRLRKRYSFKKVPILSGLFCFIKIFYSDNRTKLDISGVQKVCMPFFIFHGRIIMILFRFVKRIVVIYMKLITWSSLAMNTVIR